MDAPPGTKCDGGSTFVPVWVVTASRDTPTPCSSTVTIDVTSCPKRSNGGASEDGLMSNEMSMSSVTRDLHVERQIRGGHVARGARVPSQPHCPPALVLRRPCRDVRCRA